MPADYSKIHRLLKIMTLVQGERGWTASRLAQECGCAERTIYRDLRDLEEAGVPCRFDEEREGYAIGREFFMPAVALTLEESLALVALAQSVGEKEQIPFVGPAGKAIQKIRCNLPRGIQGQLDAIDPHIAIQLGPVNSAESSGDVYEVVRRALARRRALSCRYDSLNHGEGAMFELRPYQLYFSRRAWYVVGWHGGHEQVRTLKLSRFTQCTETERGYEIPADFSMKEHLGNAWSMIRGEKTYEVELAFDAEFAETVADTQWHATQEVEWQEDGSIVFRCRVDGLDEIAWWILSMGPHCVVRGPGELVDRVRGLIGEMGKKYGEGAKERE